MPHQRRDPEGASAATHNQRVDGEKGGSRQRRREEDVKAGASSDWSDCITGGGSAARSERYSPQDLPRTWSAKLPLQLLALSLQFLPLALDLLSVSPELFENTPRILLCLRHDVVDAVEIDADPRWSWRND